MDPIARPLITVMTASEYGLTFAETFEGLSKLLCPEEHGPVDPNTVSRAAAGPGAVGPAGKFPDVVVPEPKGAKSNACYIC